MIEPVTVIAALAGTHRLASAAEWLYQRRADERIQRELIKCGSGLPAGAEVGEIRPDGTRWWIRVAAAPRQ